MDPQVVVAPEEAFLTPQWVHDAVFYQIFPDRFAGSLGVSKPAHLEPWDKAPSAHSFKGGDLMGIVEHLDYLEDLGITAIYLNPIFQSTANHRYHTHDYFAVDPLLGGNKALEILVQEVHQRGMRLVLDGVFNHASRSFFQFSHLLENGPDSPYADWFSVYSWPLYPYDESRPPGYECWWNLRALPKFATHLPAVREFLWGVAEHWIKQGVDGWRLDVPGEIDDDEFWREFRRRVKGTNPDAYIVGEIWDDARRWLAGDQFDAVMNYIFTRACLGFFASTGAGIDQSVIQETGLLPLPALNAEDFRSTIDRLMQMYSWSATLSQLNILGSHDTPRYLTIARGDESAFRLAVLFQMTFPGAPCVYYGDEIGMQGSRDPDCRRAFPWDRSLWNEDLRGYVKRCIGMRQAHAVLRRGSFRSIQAQDGLYVFARTLGVDTAVVALNTGHESRRIDVAVPEMTGTVQTLWGDTSPPIVDGVLRDWLVPSRSGCVLLGS